MAKKFDDWNGRFSRNPDGDVQVNLNFWTNSDEYPDQRKTWELNFLPKDRPNPVKAAWVLVKDDMIQQAKDLANV